jgi:SAM-dependent methyltransferase
VPGTDGGGPLDEYRAANRANWDDRVPIHRASRLYDVDGFLADPEKIGSCVALDAPLLGDVAGKRLLHLQCHFGKDTLGWARLGADVTGVDFSETAIAEARRFAAAADIDARFVVSELYAAPRALPERFDVVYTGIGAINWLPDIRGWAEVVAGFLEPGGTFFMREGHPMMWTLDWRDDDQLVVRFPYFETERPGAWDAAETYAGDGNVEHTRTYEWNHGLGEILAALTAAGLRIVDFAEHRELWWQGTSEMVEGPDELWRLPEAQRDLVPLMYHLKAEKVA